MNNFSLPADFNTRTIDKYHVLNNAYPGSRVCETYGNITLNNLFGSGRSADMLPRLDLSQLAQYIKYSKERDIDFNYTINASHLENIEFTQKGILEFMQFLGKLYEAGVRSLTIALPSLMEIVQASKYDFDIKASVICQITNANKAAVYNNMYLKRIVVDEALNRDFAELKRINNAFNGDIEVIINSICSKDCSQRMFHYNQISTDSISVRSDASAKYYPHRCLLRRYEDIGNMLRLTWIRPEDIKYYSEMGIRYFKFQGRHTVVKGDPARAVEAYFAGSHDGDLLELLDLFNPTTTFRVHIDNKKLDDFIHPFVKQEGFCTSDCDNCRYCSNYAEKVINADEVRQMANDTEKFFKQYDPFQELIDNVTGSKAKMEPKQALQVDFEL
jgi:collagenase-like PrtC family protease